MRRHDIFPMTALAILGALEGKTAEEMGQSLLEEEEEMAKERNKKMSELDKLRRGEEGEKFNLEEN